MEIKNTQGESVEVPNPKDLQAWLGIIAHKIALFELSLSGRYKEPKNDEKLQELKRKAIRAKDWQSIKLNINLDEDS